MCELQKKDITEMVPEDAGLTFSEYIKWIALAAISVITFFLRRIIGAQDNHQLRIEAIERSTVAREDHNKAIDKIEAKMDSHRGETLDSFNRVFERLDSISDRLGGK
jgi:hypothetical protein